MPTQSSTPFDSAAWPELQQLADNWQTSLLDLFAANPDRAGQFSLKAGPLFLDYSKTHLDQKTLNLLAKFAQEAALPEAIKALLTGAEVNNTERRPALHSGLRSSQHTPADKRAEVDQTLADVEAFVGKLHSGNWHGHTGKAITDVVNVGIGGSDLGPRMVVTALKEYQVGKPKVHFVANIDGADLTDVIAELNPETTLFIIASKSFSTLETRENALAARRWMLAAGCPDTGLAQHFVAVSSNIAAAVEFGISEDNIFPMWDWVGGRYSLWSAIGLPIAVALGFANFGALLAGAEQMDSHFAQAPLTANMPVLLALLTYWYSAGWGYESQAILPYAQRLSRLPAYLQQLDMESLGKSVARNGEALSGHTGLVLWGTEGTNGQHSFHQRVAPHRQCPRC
jgi:glucose-6-phosphate isomerase